MIYQVSVLPSEILESGESLRTNALAKAIQRTLNHEKVFVSGCWVSIYRFKPEPIHIPLDPTIQDWLKDLYKGEAKPIDLELEIE
jgi:hypothetical protein